MVKYIISDDLFSGFSIEMEPQSLELIEDIVKKELVSFLLSRELYLLVDKAKKLEFHIHGPKHYPQIYLCTHSE